MESSEIQKQLAQPFAVGELKFFPVALTQDKKKGKVGSYIDARAVMDRLDSVVGVGGWTTAYRCIDPGDKAVECTLSVRYGDTWVEKADVGYPNEARDADNPEKEPWKAAYSDALKRAAVQHGVGRYIYHIELERDWLPVDQYGKFTEQPRIKGAARAVEAQPQNAAANVAPSAPPAPPPTPLHRRGKPQFWAVIDQMGYRDEDVIALSKSMFNGAEPSRIGTTQAKELLVELGDRKRKEAASA